MKTVMILPRLMALCLTTCCLAAAADANVTSPAGFALESIFNPQRAPAQKTMGLLQRSFLDLVESSEGELQVAFVIDGTDSMAEDIEGVRAALKNMMDDLRQYKGDRVSFALVVYRDVGAPSGEIVVPLNQFTNNEQALTAAFQNIVPETGAPYFLEVPDLGVHEALDKLNWSEGKESSRWLLLFGDAPPYDANFKDTEQNTGAKRHFDTDLLINLAQRKGVQISCILCTSRPQEREVYKQVLDRTRQFMNSLATSTGGLMLDLSYPDIRSALLAAAKKQRVERQRVGTITQQDVEAARQASAALQPVAAGQKLRVAVVPHLPFDQITFDPTHEAVQIATELRHKFKSLPRTEVRSPVDVDRALRRVAKPDLNDEQTLQALAVQLRVDYVVWGSLRSARGIVQVNSAVYSKTDGKPVVQTGVLTSSDVPQNELAANLVNRLTLADFQRQRAPELYSTFSEVRNDASLNKELLTPVAMKADSRADLLTGFESLEQALAYTIGDPAAIKLLEQAEQALGRAADQDVRNPFTHMLLASCYYNQAQVAANQGKPEEAKTTGQQYIEALKRAYREIDNSQIELLKTEIAADYALLVKKDYNKAIELYQQLTSAPNDAKLHTALRAHWMLAGIYSGDWGVVAQMVNGVEARKHLVQILAHWPESPEAMFIKSNLRWNEDKGRNQFENFPRTAQAVLPNA